MALQTVTLTWDITDLLGNNLEDTCTIFVTPSSVLSSSVNSQVIPAVSKSVTFSGGTGSMAGIIANDNVNVLPINSAYEITVTSKTSNRTLMQFYAQINHSNGATQDLSTLYDAQVTQPQNFAHYLQAQNNLDDISVLATAQANLGLNSLAVGPVSAIQQSFNTQFLSAGATYNASVNDLACANCTSGNSTVTLPAAPANGSTVSVKLILQNTPSGGTGLYSLTVNTQGSDKFETSSGGTSANINMLNESATWRYNSSSAVWVRQWGVMSWTQIQKNMPQVLNVRSYGADPTGVADSTAAINAAIATATGPANPATTGRTATVAVYLPVGSYKVTGDLLIQSVLGFNFFGDGPEQTIIVASGTGFTTAILNIDGSYAGRYHGFTIKGDGTEQVTNGINLTWTTGANRSTTGNKFSDIRMRNLNFVTGFSMAGVTNRQVDSTRLDCVVVSGQNPTGSWSNSGNWQKGFEFGNGTFANIYDQVLTRCEPSNVYYGFYNNVSSFSLNGSQPANNFCDFYMNPGAQSTVTNVQSQNCGQLLIAPSNFSPQPNTFNDIQVKTSYLNSNVGNAFITLAGGIWNFNNVTAAATQVSGVYTSATISLAGSSTVRPCVANFSNLVLFGARTSAFTISNSVVTVLNYSNYNPSTGNYTYASGDVASFNQGAAWTTIGGPGNPPNVTYITSTGNTSYPIPANAQTLDVLVVGAGAGGSSGAYSNATNAGGGAGGGGGGVSRMQFSVAALTSPINVNVGVGGNGGAAVTSAGNGNSGVAGGNTTFGNYLWAQGGRASSGGSGATPIVAVTGGAGGTGLNVPGQAGSTLATAGTPTAATGQGTGGGGPGGAAVGTTVAAGSNGGTITNIASWGTPGAGILAITLSTGFPTGGGTITVATSNTPAVVTYTGVSGNTLTGCAYVSGGTGTVATGGQVSMAANGAGCTAPVLGVSSNSSAGGVVGGSNPTNGNAPSAQGDTAPGGGGGAAAFGAASSAQQGASAQANSGGGGGGGGGNQGGTTSGAGGNGGSGFALIIAYFQ